jgi:cytoskeleton-associated protein 5
MASFVEPVDIMPKIPQDFHTHISSSKWKDRKETLDAVFEVVKVTPRIVDADGISDIVRALANRMSDANINVVMVAASVVGALAKGIGKPFAKFKNIVVPPMLERLKERKQSVIDALSAGLDDFFTTASAQPILPYTCEFNARVVTQITFPDLTDDFMKFLKHKNPQVREGTLKFLNRCLSTTRIAPNKPDLKPYSEALVELLGDSQESIRNAAQEGLALFMKIFGERMLNPYLEPVDDLKKGKVKEALEKVTVKCKAGSAPAPPPHASSKPVSGPPKVWRSPFCESCSADT